MEGTSFFSGSKPTGRILVKNVVKHKNKIVTSDVDITVVLVVKVKIKKSSVKIFQKMASQNFLNSEFLVCIFWHIWDRN